MPTASAGVVAVSPAAYSLQEMIGFADLALYQAKASGRNCVRVIVPAEDGAGEEVVIVPDAPPLKPLLVSSARRSRSNAS